MDACHEITLSKAPYQTPTKQFRYANLQEAFEPGILSRAASRSPHAGARVRKEVLDSSLAWDHHEAMITCPKNVEQDDLMLPCAA